MNWLLLGGTVAAALLAVNLLKKQSAVKNLDVVIADVAIKDLGLQKLSAQVKVKINNPTSGTLRFTKPYPVVLFNDSPIVTGVPSAEQVEIPARGSLEMWVDFEVNSLQLLTKGGSIFERIKGGDNITLSVIVKTDVGGVNVQSNVYEFQI